MASSVTGVRHAAVSPSTVFQCAKYVDWLFVTKPRFELAQASFPALSAGWHAPGICMASCNWASDTKQQKRGAFMHYHALNHSEHAYQQ
jgi:hypothetical protein